jgi:iron complex outermembrane receptor protein
VQNKADKKWLPLAGLIFQPKENISIYGSYSTSFVPVSAAVFNNFGLNPFKPTAANSIEGGIKAELFDKKLIASAAYFDIKKKDTLNTFTCLTAAQLTAAGVTIPAGATIATGTCSAQIGGERSKGFEIEVSANPLPGLSLTTGYAHTTARVTDSSVPVQIGARLLNSPDDAFNMWVRYDFQKGPLEGFGVGVGASYIGDRVSFLPTVLNRLSTGTAAAIAASNAAADLALKTMPLESYTVFDMGLYYQVNENLNFTLKATNLLDKRYIESAGFNADIALAPGTPRTLTLSARFNF